MIRYLAAFTLIATGATADCPPPPDIAAKADAVIAQLQSAPNERFASSLSNDLWQLWTQAPDAKAQTLLDRGMARRQSYDFNGAIDDFDALIEYCPTFAEGYNQKAFANFLRGDYEAALGDLNLALDRSPRHVAALSGKALTLLALERDDEGQAVLRQALELNPWLSERQFLTEPLGKEL